MKTQQGSALIISLLILLVMTMLGITSMSTSTLEEKMAANDRNQKIALHRSELALVAAEEELSDKNWTDIQTDIDANTAGYYSITDAQPDYFDEANWVVDISCIKQSVAGNESCYTLEHVYDPPALNVGTYGGVNQANMSQKILRVTAYANDNSGMSGAKVQSYLNKTYLP